MRNSSCSFRFSSTFHVISRKIGLLYFSNRAVFVKIMNAFKTIALRMVGRTQGGQMWEGSCWLGWNDIVLNCKFRKRVHSCRSGKFLDVSNLNNLAQQGECPFSTQNTTPPYCWCTYEWLGWGSGCCWCTNEGAGVADLDAAAVEMRGWSGRDAGVHMM